MNYLITYDIKSNKKRKKVSDFLDGYGLRINLSVYECQLTKKALKEIKTNLKKILNRKTDSISLYRICKNCNNKSKSIGKGKEPFAPIDLNF